MAVFPMLKHSGAKDPDMEIALQYNNIMRFVEEGEDGHPLPKSIQEVGHVNAAVIFAFRNLCAFMRKAETSDEVYGFMERVSIEFRKNLKEQKRKE